jgi:DNA polymerase theta
MVNQLLSNNIIDVCNFLGLPVEICNTYETFGIKCLYEWQKQCIDQIESKSSSSKSLVYCAPTSGGKSLISEFIILKNSILLGKISIFVLPFVSLVLEKSNYFKKLLRSFNSNQKKSHKIKVKPYYGDVSCLSLCSGPSVLICTIEKANSVINALITRKMIQWIGCVVIDEIHTLGNPFNGSLLEILIR